MAVDHIDAQIQSLISSAQIETQKKIGDEDDSDHARKVAERKLAEKKLAEKRLAEKGDRLEASSVRRALDQRRSALVQRARPGLGGAPGHEAAGARGGPRTSGQQPRVELPAAREGSLREALAGRPAERSTTAAPPARLAGQSRTERAAATPRSMGAHAPAGDRAADRTAGELVRSRFMRSPASDMRARSRFLRFALRQAAGGRMESVRKAGDMLGSLVEAGVGRSAQRAAVEMAARRPADLEAMSSLDAFVRNPHVRELPRFARTEATKLLAEADGEQEVKEGFERLVRSPELRAQTARNKGRFFATIGTGRPSELRALADHALLALRSSGFPQRAAEVRVLLGKMAAQVRKGGAAGVDVARLIEESRSPPLPRAPDLSATGGLAGEEAARAGAHNRARVMRFFNQVRRSYEQAEKRLNSAKYLEEVNALTTVRRAEELDVSTLSAEEQAFVRERQAALDAELDQLRGLQRRRARELRTRRMPPARRRAVQAARRARSLAPSTFSPGVGAATRLFAQPDAGAPGTVGPAGASTRGSRAAPVAGGSIQEQVASAVARLGGGALTAEGVGRIARGVANQVARQVVAQVTELLGVEPATGGPQAPGASRAPGAARGVARDGWGIPRALDRDLGGGRRVEPPPGRSDPGQALSGLEAVEAERYAGRAVVEDRSSVRRLGELFSRPWKQLTRAETALLRNLGWSRQLWDAKESTSARWPAAMATAFAGLTPIQRESVRELGFTARDWDEKVQALATTEEA